MNSQRNKPFFQRLKRLVLPEASQDYKDGFLDGFQAGMLDASNTLVEWNALAREEIRKQRKEL